MIERLNVRLIDLHKHAFTKQLFSVECCVINTLPTFAGISIAQLKEHLIKNARINLLTTEEYLTVY